MDECCGAANRPLPKSDACHDGDQPSITEQRPPWWRDPALLPAAISGVSLAVGYGLAAGGFAVASVVAQAVSLLTGAYTFVPGALKRLVRGKLGVGTLMTLAAVGAVALGRVGEAAALAFLFSLAEALEDRAMDRAKEGLRSLLALIPNTVRVVRAAAETIIDATEVRIGDVLIVGAGERVATDGIVMAGRSSVNTAAVTGESIPVEVGPASPIAAGSINGSGTLRITATADGRDNSLTQIVALVEQAQSRQGERARLADRIARPLVPSVLLAAVLVAGYGVFSGDFWTWAERALVVLVSASPCALAIAVPVTVITAVGAASRFGAIIKSGEAFEQLGEIHTVALDKTGTLTCNQPRVAQVAPATGWTRAEVLELAAALETSSSHPLAAAITAAAPDTPGAAEVVEEPGNGLRGRVGNIAVRVGNTRWLDPTELTPTAAAMAQQGMTVVAVTAAGKLAGLIGVRDELRPEAAETIGLLRGLGINVAMLTGDNERTARALAAQAGITHVHAEQLPGDKAAAITALNRRNPTAMVGDGINDAPALASATVGIAMGLKGAAAAVESAAVAFTGEDLRLLAYTFDYARRGRRIMTANIAMSLGIIVALVPLALFGVLGLTGVVLVHEATEVAVILNGLRAARHSQPKL
ncbi:MAG: cadmium-translocating P-type ATPase, partial [Propionibacteriaceae bacterium]|nr:cadmium-translocating P-type ATPase [Propionibacteriaceae bacterium]